MVRIKPKIDGRGATTGFYDGPPPTPGLYKGIVKKMGLAKISGGENAGMPRIALLLEVSEGPFKGAGIVHSLNETEQGKGYINQFLHAMTDGSEEQKSLIEEWYWELGYDTEAEDDGKMGKPFNFIGKPKFKPIGKSVAFVVRSGSYDGKPKAEIANFVVPVPNSSEDDDAVEEEALESTETVVEEDDSTPENSSDDDTTTVEDDGGESADDPWGDDD